MVDRPTVRMTLKRKSARSGGWPCDKFSSVPRIRISNMGERFPKTLSDSILFQHVTQSTYVRHLRRTPHKRHIYYRRTKVYWRGNQLPMTARPGDEAIILHAERGIPMKVAYSHRLTTADDRHAQETTAISPRLSSGHVVCHQQSQDWLSGRTSRIDADSTDRSKRTIGWDLQNCS